MSSVTSDLTAVPLNGLYAATKGGVDALTKTAAIEVAKEGISINALAFLAADVDNGTFQRFLASTGLPQEQVLSAIPIGRLLSAAELCAAVRYLSSDEARFAVWHHPDPRRWPHGHVGAAFRPKPSPLIGRLP